MKKFVLSCGVALLALLGSFGMAPAAQAYPDVIIDLTVNRQVLYGGENFTATGTSNVDCSWTTEWNDVVRTGPGTPADAFTTTYTAPEVTQVTKIPLHGTCEYVDPTVRAAATTATWERTIMITVLPRGQAAPPTDNGTSDLPNTGGPNLAFLLGGLGLLFVGATAVTVARRRAENVDIATFQA